MDSHDRHEGTSRSKDLTISPQKVHDALREGVCEFDVVATSEIAASR
jgi:hypothetical protein